MRTSLHELRDAGTSPWLDFIARTMLQDGELVVLPTMHERKARMAALADAFVALPGGFGTFDEFCEMATWDQLGILIGIVLVTGLLTTIVPARQAGRLAPAEALREG